MSMEWVESSPIPDLDFHSFRQEVLALPPRKQAKWHGHTKDAYGVVHRVYFVNGNFVYKCKSIWIRLVPMTQLQMANELGDVEFGEPGAEDYYRRAINAFDRGGREAVAEEMNRFQNENATGNHRTKPRRVKVPTTPGESVRG
jgi:hypothetical protein